MDNLTEINDSGTACDLHPPCGSTAKPVRRALYFFKGAAAIASARIIGYAMSFARNIILARTLTKADYGMSAAFASTVSLLELSGRFGLGQLLIRSRRGNAQSFMASLHTVQLASGFVSALLLLTLCRPMADMFHVPGATWAFGALSVIPIANSLWHLDNWRVQRNFNFVPCALTELVPQTVVTLAAWPLTRVFHDYRAIVILLVAKAILALSVTHVLAKRRYALKWNQRWCSEIYVWAWPLLASNVIVFASGQANQLVIGGAFSVSRLAGYAIATSLVSIPWFIISNVGSSLLLPILSRAVDSKQRFEAQLLLFFGVSSVAAVLLSTGFVFFGENAVVLLFGKGYQGCGIYVTILGAGIAVRLLGIVTTLAALAWGDTTNELFSNIWMSVSLPLSLLAVYCGLGPAWVAGCVAFGEFVGLIASFWRLRRIFAFSVKDAAVPFAYFFFFLLVIAVVLSNGIERAGLIVQICGCVCVCVVALGVGVVVFPWLRDASSCAVLLSEDELA